MAIIVEGEQCYKRIRQWL